MKAKFFRAILVSAVAALVSTQSYASWDVTGKVDYIEVSAEVRLKVGSMSESVNPGGCGYHSEYALPTDSPNFEAIYSLLLMAKATGKNISLDLNGCTYSGSQKIFNKVVGVNINE